MLSIFKARFFSSHALLAPSMEALRKLDYWRRTCGSGHEPEMRPQPIPIETTQQITDIFGIKPETRLGPMGITFSSLGKLVQDSFLAALTFEANKKGLVKTDFISLEIGTMLNRAKVSADRNQQEEASRKSAEEFTKNHPVAPDPWH